MSSETERPPRRSALWIGIFTIFGLSIFGGGCRSYNIAKANKQIARITARELLTKPPEKPRWVEIEGHPIAGSTTTMDNSQMIIFADPDDSSAVMVQIRKDSSLPAATNSTVVRGMSMLRPQNDKPLPKLTIPPGCRVAANLVIKENDSPPGWFSSWGLMIIGGLMFMAASNAYDEWSKS